MKFKSAADAAGRGLKTQEPRQDRRGS